MPAHLPALLAARPTQRSLVVRHPIGYLQASALLLGIALVVLNILLLAARPSLGLHGLGALLGLGLVLWAGRRLVRGWRPWLLIIEREVLYLAPLGTGLDQPTETIPLGSIVAYSYWSRLLKYTYILQYHLRLELADGRVLHLADRPGTRSTDPAGTVRLDVLIERLNRRAKSKTGPLRRPLFFQTRAAQLLLWGSGALLAGGAGLLAVGQLVGVLLLFPPVLYGACYYLGQGDAYAAA